MMPNDKNGNNPRPNLITLIDISIKLKQNQDINIKITEDPECQAALNFYDIQYQIENQLNKYKSFFSLSLTAKDKGGQNKKETEIKPSSSER